MRGQPRAQKPTTLRPRDQRAHLGDGPAEPRDPRRDADIALGDVFGEDHFPQLRADRVVAVPPWNQKLPVARTSSRAIHDGYGVSPARTTATRPGCSTACPTSPTTAERSSYCRTAFSSRAVAPAGSGSGSSRRGSRRGVRAAARSLRLDRLACSVLVFARGEPASMESRRRPDGGPQGIKRGPHSAFNHSEQRPDR